MVKLSRRMKAVASMVQAKGILADVGTDHGYIPIALVQEHKIKGAIAMDIREGPLFHAKENIKAAHLESYIQTRLSDGLEALKAGEADSVLIAGMGGELTLHILEEGKEVCSTLSELILQPQSQIGRVREYLRTHGYRITEEDMVFEDGKYYPMMHVIVKEDDRWGKMEDDSIAVCDLYGFHLLQSGNPVLLRFLKKEERRRKELLCSLEKHKSTGQLEERIHKVKEELRLNRKALAWCTGQEQNEFVGVENE